MFTCSHFVCKKKLSDNPGRLAAVQLANHLGAIDVDEMLHAMTPDQFLERLAALHLSMQSQDESSAMQTPEQFAENFKRI